ncbi:MAG: hypothetical protein AAGB35_06260 [Pseudomonadota bacterium]
MSQHNKQRLELISPWSLEPEMLIEEDYRVKAHSILKRINLLLDEPAQVAKESILSIESEWEMTSRSKLVVDMSNTSLSNDDIQTYDTYFGISHVQDEKPGLSLIDSFVISLKRFYELIDNLDETHNESIKIQLEGFKAHSHLLLRVLNLEHLN